MPTALGNARFWWIIYRNEKEGACAPSFGIATKTRSYS